MYCTNHHLLVALSTAAAEVAVAGARGQAFVRYKSLVHTHTDAHAPSLSPRRNQTCAQGGGHVHMKSEFTFPSSDTA
jgi:hypothetical protein